MANVYTTITCGGNERTLADWGIAEESITFARHAGDEDTLSFTMPTQRIEDDPLFAFESKLVLKTGRTSADGSLNSFSGGKTKFTGWAMDPTLDGRPSFEGVHYTVVGPWYWIRKTEFQQYVYKWTGFGVSITPELTTDVALFYQVLSPNSYARVHTGDQIKAILNFVLVQCGNMGIDTPFLVGYQDIDVPVLPYPANDIMCDEAIELCLRSSPDARLIFDYSTTPPTANVISLANCTPKVFPVADGLTRESIVLRARRDMLARAVVVNFKRVDSVDGVDWEVKSQQKFGPNGLNSPLDPAAGPRVALYTVNLEGAVKNDEQAELIVTPVANTREFWSKVIPELQSTNIRAFTVSNLQVKDDEGNPVDLGAYPNYVMGGTGVCTWMTSGGHPVNAIAVTITAEANYKQFDVNATGPDPEAATNGSQLDKYSTRQLSVRGTLTNGTSGVYSKSDSIAAEDEPAGLAEKIYNSLATLAYDGRLTNKQVEIGLDDVNMDNSLCISGGRPEWLTMNAQIQSITESFGDGGVEIVLGYPKELSAGDYARLMLVNRNRKAFSTASERATGKSDNAGSVKLQTGAVKENSNAGLDEKSYTATILKSAGTQVAKIEHDTQVLKDITPSMADADRVMKPRVFAACIAGNRKMAAITATDVFDTA